MKLAVNTVTLRSQSPQEVVNLLTKAHFDAVEWAGDAHVPPGKIEVAKTVKAMSDKAGIKITSYGAYYQCDKGGPEPKGPFSFNLGAQAALDSARALAVSDIRVWAGRKASANAHDDYRAEVSASLAAFCDQAKALGLRVHLEFHRNTLTDTVKSTLSLLDAVSRDNLFSYWQPRHGNSVEENIADINALGDRLSNVHVFHWVPIPGEGFAMDRRPLAEGKDRWATYFSALEKLPGERYAMLEFVSGDTLEQFYEDARVLHELQATQYR